MLIAVRLEHAVARHQNRAPEKIYQRLRPDDKDDELCWVMQPEENNQRWYMIQGMGTKANQDFRRRRRNRLMNRPHDDLSWQEDLAKTRPSLHWRQSVDGVPGLPEGLLCPYNQFLWCATKT